MNNLPKIALGAWAWGNDGTFGDTFTAEKLRTVFDAAMSEGLNLWDTAYAYGMGTVVSDTAGTKVQPAETNDGYVLINGGMFIMGSPEIEN